MYHLTLPNDLDIVLLCSPYFNRPDRDLVPAWNIRSTSGTAQRTRNSRTYTTDRNPTLQLFNGSCCFPAIMAQSITTTITFPLLELPQPLVEDILLLALDISWNRPTNVFLLCRNVYEYLRPKYLKSVCLGSIEQVKRFAESDGIRRYGGDVKNLR